MLQAGVVVVDVVVQKLQNEKPGIFAVLRLALFVLHRGNFARFVEKFVKLP